MKIRRISEHLKDQNWFAVALDFIIVVIGVGAALMAQQWLGERQGRAELERALSSLNSDLFRVYFVSKERLAVADCRKERYAELGALLLETEHSWPGSAREYPASPIQPALPVVVRSPHRYWTSAIWETELAKGTFNRMDNDSLVLLASVFSRGEEAESIQAMIRDLESNLQALAHPLQLDIGDRLRYYDILARADSASSLLEVVAAQHVDYIEAFGLRLISNEDEAAVYRQFLADQNARAISVYGDCVVPMAFPFLEEGNFD